MCGPGAWQVALALDKSGEITGVLPYHFTRRWGLKVIQLPPLTTYAGPWLIYPQTPDFKDVSRLSFEKKVMTELIRQLPQTVFFRQNFIPEITNWLPFYWQKFRQTTRYTYRFDPIQDLEKIRAGFKNTLRSDLKKAGRLVNTARDDEAWETVFQLNQRSFQRKGRRQPYGFEVFKNLHNTLFERKQSAVFIARGKDSEAPSAGLYLVFDRQEASILLTGTAPEFKSQCAIYLLIWEALVLCSERSLRLDFEGSMDENIERAFRAFGATLVPYFQISRFL